MPGASAVRAGRAFVEFFGKDAPLVKSMNGIKKKLEGFGKDVAKIGGAVTAAGLAVLTPLLGATKLFDEMGSQLVDMSAKTGAGIESLSTLGYAAKQSGSNLEEVGSSLGKMSKFLVGAASGGKEANETLHRIGLTVADLAKLSPEDQFRLLGTRIAAIPNPAQRAATAMEVFGKSGANLLPMLSALGELEDRARSLGLQISTEDAQAADSLGDAWGDLIAVGRALVFQVGAALAPAVTSAVSAVAEGAGQFIRWLSVNRELIVTIAKIAAIVVAVGTGITVLGGLIAGIGAAFGVLASIVTAVGTGLAFVAGLIGFLVSPIGLAITAIAGLTAWFFTMTDTGQKALEWLAESFATTANDAIAAFNGIRDALASGDLSQAMTILGAFLTLQWKRVTTYFSTAWNEFLNWFVQASIPIAKQVAGIFISMAVSVAKSLVEMTDAIQKALGKELIPPATLKALQTALPIVAAGATVGINNKIDQFGKGVKASTAANISDAAADVDGARAAFDDAIKLAAQNRKKFEASGKRKDLGIDVPDLRAGLESAKATVSGTFSAAAARSLGGSRQLDDIATNTKQTASGIKKLAGKPQGLPVS